MAEEKKIVSTYYGAVKLLKQDGKAWVQTGGPTYWNRAVMIQLQEEMSVPLQILEEDGRLCLYGIASSNNKAAASLLSKEEDI